MRYRYAWFTLIACLFISACASTIKVGTDYDPEHDFSSYRNYAWYDQVRAPNQIIEDRFRHAVEAALTANGYNKVAPGNSPQFLVSFTAVAEQAISTSSISTGMGYRRRGLGVGVSTTNRIREYTRGTLVIDIIEPGSKYLLWRGATSAALDASLTPEEKTRVVNETVAAVLEKFPPGAY